ncbi:MAG: DNA primase [Rickettsiales bacterium]|jgi:DNA primase|nr:DNA primase [Rickettsiales bacterium]
MESLKPFVEELKQRASIADIIGRSVPLKLKGRQWWGCCPFHNEKTPSFSVNEEMGIFKCFGCGEGGDIITFLMKKNNIGYIDAVRELAAIVGVKMPDFKPRDPEEEKREISYFEILGRAADIFAEKLAGSPAEEYLKKRGLGPDVIERYKLGYAPKNNIIAQMFGSSGITAGLTRHSQHGGADYDFFRGRLMFPIINIRGNVVAFSGRSLDGSEPKYINIAETEFFAKRRTLFGIHFAIPEIRQKRRAIIVEGQIDCIQMQMHGFGETIAPLGTALTTEHIEILLKYAKELVFCFDGDTAGQKAAARAAGLIFPLLKSEMVIKFAFMPDKKDPDEVLSKGGDMNEIINSAKLLPNFVWELANKTFAILTESGRVQAGRWIRLEYEKIPDLFLRNEMLTTLKSREWDSWNKYRHVIVPEMKTPDPSARQARLIAEIRIKFPDLYEQNFELLGVADSSEPCDSRMTRETAQKIIREIELNKRLENLAAEHAPAERIQKIKDEILDLWN